MIQFFPTRQVAIEIVGFSIHWYGLLYLFAFLLAYHLIVRLQHYRSLSLSKDDISSLLSFTIGGVIIGGRLGYVVFYELFYFIKHPLEIVMVWHGGMSSHGGFIGVTIALLLFLRKRRIAVLSLLDVIVVPIALGLACGRIGNFINWELYGVVTTVPWAMQIPGVEGLRHPTFFYSFIKDICIALVCYIHLRKSSVRSGETFALFLMLYGILRFSVEYFREQPYGWIDFGILSISRGQLFTIPIFCIGSALFWYIRRRS